MVATLLFMNCTRLLCLRAENFAGRVVAQALGSAFTEALQTEGPEILDK